MQYMMTLVTISSFVQDGGHHPISPGCNNIATAPNIDAALGYLATIVAYMLIGEMILQGLDVIYRFIILYFIRAGGVHGFHHPTSWPA